MAGIIQASAGGSNPPLPYPQGPRTLNGTGTLINGGSDWNGGGFFTGYWLTTGAPTTQLDSTGIFIGSNGDSLHDARFVGGWYTYTTFFDLFSGDSGVYVAPNPGTTLIVTKQVSVDGGKTFVDAPTAAGSPTLPPGTHPWYRYVVTNTGLEDITSVTVTDPTTGFNQTVNVLTPGQSYSWIVSPSSL